MPKRYYTLHPPGCGWNLRANLIVVCILKLSYALGVPIPPHACTSGPPVSRMGPPTVTLQQGIPVPAAVPALEARRLIKFIFLYVVRICGIRSNVEHLCNSNLLLYSIYICTSRNLLQCCTSNSNVVQS